MNSPVRKVCIVITARSSYARIKSVLAAIKENNNLELQLVVAASALLERYGNTLDFIEADGFKPSASVYMVLEGENLASMAKTTGLGLLELSTVFDNLKPDIILTIADRFETLATAIAAAYMNIPVAHVQGGEVTGSIDEKVRHAVTKLSNYHFVATQKAAERVKRMGEAEDTVFVTGCPSIDLAAQVIKNPSLDFDPFKRYGGVGQDFDYSSGYLVAIQHPVTTEYEAARRHTQETLYALNEINLPVFWFWPNVDAGSDGTSKAIRIFRETEKPKNFHFFKNMAPEDFLKLIYNCKCIVGNSSVAIREASYLGVAAVNIGTRQEGRERGKNVMDAPYERSKIIGALKAQLGIGRYPTDLLYGDGAAGRRIAELLSRLPLSIEKRITY